MPSLTWETAAEQFRRAQEDGVRIIGRMAHGDQPGMVYIVTSRSQAEPHQVWTRGHVANCSCGLSTLGGKPCPHAAFAFFRACWDRATER